MEYNPRGNPYDLEEIQDMGLDKFPVFLAHVWAFLELPSPTDVQQDIAWNLQKGPRRFIIQAFRGVGKSWITVAFVLWCLFMNPQAKIEVVSASGGLAEDFVKFSNQLIRGMPVLEHLKAKHGQRAKATVFDVGPARESKDPSVKAAGIDGQITGTRADIIIADDIEIPKNSFTLHLREKLNEQVKEFDAILKPGGRVIYLGTPQVEESVYPKLAQRGYEPRIWPAEIPKNPDIYNGNLAPYVQQMISDGAPVGEPVDPARFDALDLDERRLSYGEAGYALQFMLDTSPSDADKHPLKLHNLIVDDLDGSMAPVKIAWGRSKDLRFEDLPPGGFDGDFYHRPAYKSDEMGEYQGTVMFIDPSGEGNDETAYAIVRFSHGNLFLVACGGFTSGFSEKTLEKLAAKAARHGVNRVVAETNFGGGMFTKLLKPHLAKYDGRAGRIDEDYKAWASGQKEKRILNTLEPLFGSHKLIVDRSVLEDDLQVQHESTKYSLVYQMTRLTRQKGALPHDDRVEAVAGACQYWLDYMGRDADKEVERSKEKALKKELEGWDKHVLGHSRGPNQPGNRFAKNRSSNTLH